jgi:hypothetical protein
MVETDVWFSPFGEKNQAAPEIAATTMKPTRRL